MRIVTRVLLIGAGFLWVLLIHTPSAAATWFLLLPLGAAWLMTVWVFGGSLWALLGWAIAVVSLTNAALSARLLWMMISGVGVLTGAVVAVSSGHAFWRARERLLEAAVEAAEGGVNTLREADTQLEVSMSALRQRLQRYATLRNVTEALSIQLGSLDLLLRSAVEQTLQVLDQADVAMAFLVEPSRQGLELLAVHWRDGPGRTVKRKTGDLFDEWVFRQGQPLLVRDVRKDFRFPRDQVPSDERLIGSLIIAPLISAQRVLGVLRAEHHGVEAFSADDLRLLDIIADFAAMSIENIRLYQRTSELAITDDLTGLAVHRYFHERLEEELSRVRRHNNSLSLLLVDLDHFKRYNDTYGHPAGDKLLRAIAQALQRWQGPGDLIARYGGEEFAILLMGMDRAHAVQHAEMLRTTLAAQEIVLRQNTAHITVSIGVATFPEDGTHKEALLHVADQRLYRAKSDGRNRVCAS